MKKIIYLIISMAFIGNSYAQSAKPEVVASAGDYFKSTNYSLSWTLGECITETFSSTNNKLTQGFQQSSYSITAILQLELKGISVKAFPNPTTDFITISIETTCNSQIACSIELFDLQGKLLVNKNMEEKLMQFDMSRFSDGTYFLKVSDSKKTMIQNFKIQKN